MIERIETARLVLRKAAARDLDKIWSNVWSDASLAETMLWTPTRTREEARSRLERTVAYQAGNPGFFVCRRDTDEPVGFAGIRACEQGTFSETGICIARAHQRQGYGGEALDALIGLAFDTLGGRRFLYSCFHDNTASAALALSRGFAFSGSAPMRRAWDGFPYVCDTYVLERRRGL